MKVKEIGEEGAHPYRPLKSASGECTFFKL